MEVKKLLEDDKITACVKQICLLGLICKVLNRETLSGEMFTFSKNVWLSMFKFWAPSNLLFFVSCSLAHNQLSWNVLLFFCNPIGQFWLSGPGYSSYTAIFWPNLDVTKKCIVMFI